MTYEEFIETIKKLVEDKLGADYELTMQQVTKNNGIVLDGLTIRLLGGDIAPVIYLNAYYDQVKLGMSVEDAAGNIAGMINRDMFASIAAEVAIRDYENMKPLIMFRIVQAEANKKMLSDVPHILFLDLAIVFYLYLKENENGQITSLIHNDLMEAWEVREEELWKVARLNTMTTLTAEIRSLSEVAAESARNCLEGIVDFEAEFIEELAENDVPPLYVLTNSVGIYGAGCMIYDGVLKAFADFLDDDLVILPSSVHEVLLLSDKLADSYEYLKRMVTAVNQSDVPPVDRLSDRVYKYLRETDEIVVVTDDDMMKSSTYQISKNYR